MTRFTYIRRDTLGAIIATSDTYPGSTLGWFRLCMITGEERRLA